MFSNFTVGASNLGKKAEKKICIHLPSGRRKEKLHN
jgi:hypothetical protein